jgi:ectoine hydroxylase-related dioxygenase (phytanoyl-CoA dioxygenase family)
MKINLNNIKNDKVYLDKAIKFYEDNGYLISSINDNKLIDDINLNIQNHLNYKRDIKTNPKIFHYNESPRIVEMWKEIESVKKLAINEVVIFLLKSLYSRKPIPFSTINFLKGTEQPLHSDYFHFATKPDGYLAGVWTALEDIDESSGPLSIVPGSNKLPYVWLDTLGLDIPKNKKDIKNNYTKYEEYIKKLMLDKKFEIYTPKLMKGDFLIWSANILHGAGEIKDKSKSRLSQVTHYHFEGCEKYFNPLFTRHDQNKYGDRDLNSIKIPYE